MKANEFVKKFGWDAVKDMIQKYTKSTHVTNDACMFINSSEYKKHAPWFADDVDGMVSFDDLKRLVESHHIVNTTFKGLEDAKWWHECCWDCDSVAYIPIERLKQAISDVESCL